MTTTLSVPHELINQDREAILDYVRCRGHEVTHFQYDLPSGLAVFVKVCDDNLAQAATQDFFYRCAIRDEFAPRIPRVFDAFSSEVGHHMVVMKKLEAPTLDDCGISEKTAVKHTAFAVGWLQKQLPLVPDACFGRICPHKASIMHRMFRDHESSSPFANSDELAEHISWASQHLPNLKHRLSHREVKRAFGKDRCIYHSDIEKRNFLLLDSKIVCIIDFEHIGVLPQVFQTYAFFNTNMPFASAVGRSLGFRPSLAADRLVRIANTRCI